MHEICSSVRPSVHRPSIYCRCSGCTRVVFSSSQGPTEAKNSPDSHLLTIYGGHQPPVSVRNPENLRGTEGESISQPSYCTVKTATAPSVSPPHCLLLPSLTCMKEERAPPSLLLQAEGSLGGGGTSCSAFSRFSVGAAEAPAACFDCSAPVEWKRWWLAAGGDDALGCCQRNSRLWWRNVEQQQRFQGFNLQGRFYSFNLILLIQPRLRGQSPVDLCERRLKE